MRTKDYIDATYELLSRGVSADAVLKNLRTMLERKGLLAMYGKILRGLLNRIVRKHATEETRVIIARQGDVTRYAEALKEVISDIGGGDRHQTNVDPHLIGGFIVTHNGKRVDKSYKSTLLHVYQNIVE